MLTINLSCSKRDRTRIVPKRTMSDVEMAFKALQLSPGIQDIEIKSLTEKPWHFRVISPKVEHHKAYPLIIDLHWASGGAADAHQNTSCYLEPGFKGTDVFMIVPNGGSELWSSRRNQEMIINLVSFALTSWPIDRQKVVLTGYSNGGNGCWFYGETQSRLFSAAIPMASSYATTPADGSSQAVKMPIPMYVIHGEKDELFPLAQTQNWVQATKEVGSVINFEIAPRLTHYEACSYLPYFKNAVAWLKKQWD